LSLFIAGCFGIVGFILATLAGLYADNMFGTIITKAMGSSVVCYVVGYMVGVIAQFIAREHAVAIAKKVAEIDEAESARKESEAAARVIQSTPPGGHATAASPVAAGINSPSAATPL